MSETNSDPATGLLQGIATGGIGGIVIAILFILYKCLHKRRIKTHSGCCDFEISDQQPHDETPAPPPTPIARTPVPSVESARAPKKSNDLSGISNF